MSQIGNAARIHAAIASSEANRHAGSADAFETAMAPHRAILLLDEALVVFLIGPRSRNLHTVRPAPGHGDIIHENAAVVEIGT